MATVYMAEPPPGVKRLQGDTLKPNLIACGVVTTLIALVALIIRLYTRRFITGNALLLDDWLVCGAIVFAFLMLGFCFKIMDAGVGTHMWDVTLEQYNPGLGIYTLVLTIFYAWAISCSKLSILCFYLRLSPQLWFRYCVFGLLAFTTAYSATYALVFVFRCRPIDAGWDILVPNPVCIDSKKIMLALSVLNIVMDVLTLLLPVPVIMRLNMRTAQKITVMLLLASGTFVCAVAIQRTINMVAVLVSTDYTWDVTYQFYWCFLEMNAGIVCASVPALKPFVRRHLSSLFGSTRSGSGSGAGAGGASGAGPAGSHGRGISGSGSIPMNTVVRKNKNRREAQARAYALSSRDDDATDEARLWGKDAIAFRTHTTVVAGDGSDNSSLDSGGGGGGGGAGAELPKRPPTAAAEGLAPGGAITITKEMSVRSNTDV